MRKVLKPLKLCIDKYLYKIIIQCMDILHIKFPKKADFIIIGSHGLGRNAFLLFLQYCGVRVNWYYAFDGYYKRCYMYLSHILFKPKAQICSITFAELNVEGEDKIIDKINQKIPAIMMVRDPISILKTHINLRFISKDSPTNLQTTIIKCDNAYKITRNALDSIHHRISYRDFKDGKIIESSKPSLGLLDYLIHTTSYKFASYKINGGIKEIVLFSSMYRILKEKISKLIFIDMQDLSSQNAYHTMQRLAKELHFQRPKDRDFFTHKLYGDINALIPFTIKAPFIGGGISYFQARNRHF